MMQFAFGVVIGLWLHRLINLAALLAAGAILKWASRRLFGLPPAQVAEAAEKDAA